MIVISVHISAMLEEERHHMHVAIQRCKLQRHAVIRVHVGTVLEEKLHNAQVAVLRC